MWWEEHKKLDEKHRQLELKLPALAKLTDEERKALGLEQFAVLIDGKP